MNEVIKSRDPEAIVADLKRWNPGEETITFTEEELGPLIPPVQSRLIINENFMVEFVKPMPGWWHRFWYRLLLGWRWEVV